MLVRRGLAVVLGDLAEMGYDARWGVLGACDAGAPHRRDRIWILADAIGSGLEGHPRHETVGNQQGRIAQKQGGPACETGVCHREHNSRWWHSEPHLDRMADGLPLAMDIHGAHAAGNVARVAQRIQNRTQRLRCIGNAQLPQTAVMAWKTL